MKTIILNAKDDFWYIEISQYGSNKTHGINLRGEAPLGDLTLGYQPGWVEFYHLDGLNSALKILGLKPLSRKDEELLEDFVSGFGEASRAKGIDLCASAGILQFNPEGVSVSGLYKKDHYNTRYACDDRDSLEAKDLKELIAKIKEMNSQPI